MKNIESFIQSHFEILDPEDLKKLSQLFKEQHLKRGDYLLNTGSHCNKFCSIESGLLRIYALADDKEITQWLATKGTFGTDFASFLFDEPSRWNIQALTDTQIYYVTKSDYDKINLIVPQWKELEKRFIIKCLTFLENRVFSFLSMSAEERYNSFFKTNSEVFNQAPSQYIASMLGMTPETFSRIKKNIQ